ncbi:hypothetical protein GHT06_012857 [Daphnia sinensis]|uniref:cysteine desulfurase n=1 Tax=Daphnia sinensis TaxID=1820382 RepID=A0AAD5LFR5_9CRUS|nr:hypothetical protein GHT06_012857 [Daphnia sinensis]
MLLKFLARNRGVMRNLSLKPGDSPIDEIILCRNLLQAVVSDRHGQLHKYSTLTNIGEKITVTKFEEEGRPLYLDAQATTPVDPRVLDAMLPYMTNYYGNPHSRTHSYGWESEKAVELAREQVARLINADPKEIIFTSGATESNNIAIKGVARFYKIKKNHIITTQTEHKCVLDSCRVLEGEGFEVTYLPVLPSGLIDLNSLQSAIRPTTALVSVMSVNNEIGIKQPLAEIGAICRKAKVFFHCDAAQAVGKIPIDVEAMSIDLMSISGHKSGGGQERGLRSGTVPTPLAVGLGAACEIAKQELQVMLSS